MVHCPQCGAANPDENRICDECGAELPARGSGVRCPMCSHNNPVGRETCESCDARLVPLVAPPGSAEPRDVVAPSGPQEAQPPDTPVTEDGLDAGTPPWLRRMRDDALSGDTTLDAELGPEPAAEPAGPPEWLSRLESSSPAPPVELDSESTPVPDWLRELGPELGDVAETEIRPPSPPQVEPQVPDWLGEQASSGEELPTPLPGEAEAPDWLAELVPTEEESSVPPPTKTEMPDWLEALAPAEDELPAQQPPEAHVPDWLAELVPAEEELSVPPATEAEMPDWLAELTPTAEEPSAPAPTEVEMPDWLAELASAEEETPVPPATEAEIPDWLTEQAPSEEELPELQSAEVEFPGWLGEGAPEEEPQVSLPATAEVPDWLEEPTPATEELPAPLLPEAEVTGGLTELAPPFEAQSPDWLAEPTPSEEEPLASPAESVKLPDWLAEMEPVEVEPAQAEMEPALDEADLEQAELPAWLRAMRSGVVPAQVAEEEEVVVETSGLLAGIAGVVQPTPVVGALPTAISRPEQISSEATLARARLWQDLIARSVQPSVQWLPRARVTRLRDRIERWLVYGIVLFAVFIPVVWEVDLSTVFNLDEPLTLETQAAFDLIDEMAKQDARVLIAFDYDASFMGELDLQAEALLQHMARNKARVVAVSLTPEGAGLAQNLLDDVLTAQGYQAGQDYVNLGYVPGESVGVRSLEFLPQQFQDQAFDGKSLEDALIFEDLQDFALSNMSLIVVLTGNASHLRWWVEQMTAMERLSEKELSLVAGVSAAIEPLVRPYYDMDVGSRQIEGLVVGLMGAVDYERELGQSIGPARIRFNGQLVGQVAVLILVVTGMVVYGLARRGENDV